LYAQALTVRQASQQADPPAGATHGEYYASVILTTPESGGKKSETLYPHKRQSQFVIHGRFYRESISESTGFTLILLVTATTAKAPSG